METETLPDSTKEKPRKRSSHYSEWVEKALAEGGSRKRTSKKVSNPDFVDTDVALEKSEIKDSGGEISTEELPDLDYENLSHYEKFYKYKKEYRAWRMANLGKKAKLSTETFASSETKESDGDVGTEELPDLDYMNLSHYEKFYKYKKEYRAWRMAAKLGKKTKLPTESSSLDAVEGSSFGQDESNSSVSTLSTKEHENETTSISEENSSQADNNTKQLSSASKKQTETNDDQDKINNEETVSVSQHDPTELNNADNGNNQIKEASTFTTTPKEKVERRGRPKLNRFQRQSSGNESHSKSRSRSRQSATTPTRRETSERRQQRSDITPRQSSRFQKKLAEENTATSPGEETNDDDERMETDVDVEGAFAPPNKTVTYLDADKYCWFCHKEVKHEISHRCRTCHKIFHVRCATEFVMKTEWVQEENEWECRPCIQYREYKEKDTWAPYVEYLGHDKYKKQIRFIIEKLKKYPSAKELLRPVNTRLFPDYPQYIARPIHFELIDQRLNDGEYRCVDTLLEDIRWMVHNSVVYNGGSSGITKDLRSLLKNLRMELYDLDSCACCYIHAYTRPELWFVLPCPTPHLLVWAQLKGFPYWPAKVYDSSLEKRPGEILVKFFGDHARSWILYDNIYLYSLDPPSECPTKKKKGKQHDMISSLMEMERHVEFLKKEFSVFKYPEQDILIGGNLEERALQLKYMIPLCGTKTEAIKPPTDDTPPTKPVAPEPIKLDVNDARSKRNMLTLLEERLQQSRSDSEDSVKSFGKIRKEIGKDKKIIKVSEYKEILQLQELAANSSEHSTISRRATTRVPSNTQRGVRCQHLFSVLERKLQRNKKKQLKTKRLLKGAKRNDNQPESKVDNNDITTNKLSRTSIEANTEDEHESVNEIIDESKSNKSPVSPKLRLSEVVKKPKCGDIDSFIESHLASVETTSDWDGDRIPPILAPRDKRVTNRVQLVAMQSQEERKIESNDEQNNKDDTEHGESNEKSEESVTTSEQGDSKCDTKVDTLDERSADQEDNVEKENSTRETAEDDKTKPYDEVNLENIKKKPTTRKEFKKKTSQLSSLRLKRRLFRHKKYTAQLFQFRKLQFPRRNKQDQDSSPRNVMPDISKFFDVSKAEIKNPEVKLTSITVEEIKEIKRKVKLSKTLMRSRERKQRGSLSSSELDSGIVPIEDTMRISTESEDLTGLDSSIDLVASGILSNNYWDKQDSASSPLVQSKSSTTAGPHSSSSSGPSFRSSSLTSFPERIDPKRRPGTRYPPYSFPDNPDLKLRPDLNSHRQHVKDIVNYLIGDEQQFGGTTRVNSKKLESMADMLVGLKNQNQISVDTQYNTALNSAELVLYSEYAASYPLQELSSADYDDQFEPISDSGFDRCI